MRDQARARGLAVAANEIADTRREDLRADLGEDLERGYRGRLGGLQYERVAGRQGRADLPDGHHQRVVPGRDLADNPDRLAPDHRCVALHVLTGRTALA